ncbi:MAG: CesT family type III secretion system chaperone [Desulfobacterales bacterium]|nr:CesT family type III secretion system chaperone [Desulfobacterales bacterium]
MIEQWLEAVCSQAGWEKPWKNSRGKYRFRLEPDWVVDVWAPDERTLRLESRVAILEGQEGEAFLRKAAVAVLPRVFKDGATLALTPDKTGLILHRTVTLGALRASDFSGVMENFLNDLGFYKSL